MIVSETGVVLDPETVNHLWGDAEAHRNAAQRFLHAPGNQPDQLHSETDPVTAARLAHRLKGVAGNLGFTVLAQTLADRRKGAGPGRGPSGGDRWCGP